MKTTANPTTETGHNMRPLTDITHSIRAGLVIAAHLAAKAGVHRNVLTYIQSGRVPNYNLACRLFEALDALTKKHRRNTQTSAPVPPSRARRRSTKAGTSSPAVAEHITGAADTTTPPAAPATSTPGAHA